jgi:hypothetical protein
LSLSYRTTSPTRPATALARSGEPEEVMAMAWSGSGRNELLSRVTAGAWRGRGVGVTGALRIDVHLTR